MAADNLTTKNCTKCGCELPATSEYFYARKESIDGFKSACKNCMRAEDKQRYNADPDKRREKSRRWRKANPEKFKAQKRRAYARNPEPNKRQARQWRIDHPARAAQNDKRKREVNPEHYQAIGKHWREANSEHKRAIDKAWREANPERRSVSRLKRKARKRELPNTWTPEQWQAALDYFGGRCAYCGKQPDFWTQIVPDHYIALKDPRADNPGTVAANIVPACHAVKGVPVGVTCCNNNKKDKDPIGWLVERFGANKARDIQARIEAYFAWVLLQP